MAEVSLRLTGEAARRYARRAGRLLGDRRLNRTFVPPTELAEVVRQLVPEGDGEASLAIHAGSGLPTLPEFLRALARARSTTEGGGLERFRVDARVRRSQGAEADLKVVIDRFDPAACLFRRATVELHTGGSREIAIEGDRAELSGLLRDTLFRYAAADAELLFLRLSAVAKVQVSSVTTGQTGPLVFQGMEAPAPLRPVLQAVPDAFVLCAPTARVDVSLDDHKADDPLTPPLSDLMGAAAYGTLREAFGGSYGTVRGLVLVAERAARPALRGCFPSIVVHAA